MSEKIVFCSWAGDQSKALTIAFIDKVEPMWNSELKFWMSEDEIKPGSISMTILSKQLSSAEYGIAFITPESIDSKWIYYESGAISNNLGNKFLCPYLFGITIEDINKTPLGIFQSLQGNRSDTFKLMQQLNSIVDHPLNDNTLTYFFETVWNDLETSYTNLQKDFDFVKESIAQRKILTDGISKLAQKLRFENNYIQEIVIDYIEDINRTIIKTNKSKKIEFLISHTFYPYFLSDLLKKLPHTLTKAISIVDMDEIFWPGKTGSLILAYTHKLSIRIFAFKDRRQLSLHARMLELHAKSYKVYVISNNNLSFLFKTPAYDFCIIGDISTSSLLARYDDENDQYKTIKYMSDSEEISLHNDLMSLVTEQAIKLEPNTLISDDFIESVFHEMTPIINKPVEMSSYISINDYDKNEEKHAYFIEMMEKMLEIFNHNKIQGRRSRVLEIGAGTGIFTKRILKNKDIDFTAIEIDWTCYHILHEKLTKIDGVSDFSKESLALGDKFEIISNNFTAECYNRDARTFNPPGKFDFIFSSFADHHIKIQDKEKYFKNIKKNLNPNGLFIVGDEFLPIYDESNPASRVMALKQYHEHIIAETLNTHGNTATEFVKLESAALESGIQGLGDFKVSCNVYERHLNDTGLYVKDKILIGPQNLNDKGGIYVYVIQ